MKKTLVALAALAATSAFAQSSVQIVGNFDVGLKTAIVDKAGQARTTQIGGSNASTTAIIFKGAEDLGGGTKAIFLAEVDPNLALANSSNQNSSTAALSQTWTGTPFNSEQYVGLEGSLGQLKLGTPNSPALDTSSASQPFGTAMGSGYSSGFGRLGTASTSGSIQFVGAPGSAGRVIRNEKAAVYTSPAFNGFKAQVEYSGKNDNGGWTANDNGVLGATLRYENGPLNVLANSTTISSGAIAASGAANFGSTGLAAANATTAASYAVNALGTNSNVHYNLLGGNYTTGAATLYAGYTTTKTNGVTAAGKIEDSKSWNLGAKYALNGRVDLLANYLVRTSNLNATDADFPTDYQAKAKLLGLGADYKFSKTTNLYVRYESIGGLNSKISGAPATAASNGLAAAASYGDAKQQSAAIGLRVQF